MSTEYTLSLQQYNDETVRFRLKNPDGTYVPNDTPARFVLKPRPGVPDSNGTTYTASADVEGWVEFKIPAEHLRVWGKYFFRADSLPDGNVYTHASGVANIQPR